MKKVLLIALAITMVASVAMADSIAVYSDNQGNGCTLNFSAPGFYNSYVIHKTAAGATGSQFKVVNNTGVAWTAAIANGSFLAIGDAFTDLSLAYTSCNVGPNIVCVNLSAALFVGPTTDCGTIEVIPAPGKPYIIAVTCDFAEVPANTGTFSFGASGASSCPCGPVVATEQSTWGKVKSLYR